MANMLFKMLALGKGKQLRDYRNRVQAINELEPAMQARSDAELQALAADLRGRASKGEPLDNLLLDAFALMREASLRTIGLRQYDVQLIGAMALNDGCIAEMKTGEGKTLVATPTCFLNALPGHNVHMVTVNDYLARRDSEWMGSIFRFLGMEVGLLQNGMEPVERKPAYEADITYGTNSEFGFDYLRDNMVTRGASRVQRGHHFAIIDEVDSILIDEARTPLIISGLGGTPAATYVQFANIMPLLKPDEDFVLDETKRTIYATEEGLDRIEAMLGTEIYNDLTGQLANHLKQALRAQFLFKKDVEYVVLDGEVKIVDEFTGRIMEGRRYSEGLHQALEAKERVEINDETQTLATITLQNYFRLYDKLAGMTGTAITEDSEFRQIYDLPVVPIPTNKPVIREDKDDLIFRTVEAKYGAVADEVARRHEKGQPVLVGTASIEGSEQLSDLLRARGIPHETLNAKNPELEARIVAQAGRRGAVTIATNMAGRGTDILLGGNHDFLMDDTLEAHFHTNREEALDWQLDAASKEADYITDREGYASRLFGGLMVIGTERHESRRIDNQLRGRSGRQGDPGESQFYLSLEDGLLRRFGGDRLGAVADMMEKRGMAEDEPLQDALVSRTIDMAQKQVESLHFATRKQVLEYDDVMNLQRIAIYDERNAILDGKDVDERLPEIIRDIVDDALDAYCPASDPSDDWDLEGLASWLADMTGRDGAMVLSVDHGDEAEVLGEAIAEAMEAIVQEKRDAIPAEELKELEKLMMLRIIDTAWIGHLHEMDYLKSGIGLRAMGHRDPLVEYKQEAYQAFGEMTESIYEDFLRTLLRAPLPGAQAQAGPAALVLTAEGNPFDPSRMVYNDVEAAADPAAGGVDRGDPLR